MVRGSRSLSVRDRDILDALTLRVRVLSIPQIARIWFGTVTEPTRQATRRIEALAQAGLVEQASVPVRPELALERPLVKWSPGKTEPVFERLATILDARWRGPAKLMRLVIASRKAGHARGGSGGRWPRRSEVSHDVTLAGLYLAWRYGARESGAEWISEARLRQEGFGDRHRLPDAMIRAAADRRVIELGGAYGAAKLRDFHRFCAEQGLPYELW
ncbi:MAG: hypothetical protein DCC65_07895 [Planctomycetota bacterium]|nr:MAG: hypothetical protein DCC65_07895 [Planctomycetota bacterium]